MSLAPDKREEFDEPEFALIDTLFSLAEAHLFMQARGVGSGYFCKQLGAACGAQLPANCMLASLAEAHLLLPAGGSAACLPTGYVATVQLELLG